MQKEEITQYVVNALWRHRSHSDIIQYLCEHESMAWSEAEKLVKQIEVQHGSEINARQSPILIVLSIISMIGGVALIGYTCFYFFNLMQQDTINVVKNSRGAVAAIATLIIGTGLIARSIASIRKTIKDFFEHKDNR